MNAQANEPEWYLPLQGRDDKVIAARRGFESEGGDLQRGCVTGDAAEVSRHGCLCQVVWKPWDGNRGGLR